MKTDMNAVLNKKFGTSSDYPPADWAPTVNLMGPLPEKTIVSSPIADFSDGADDVPTKSLVVTIPPTLSGVSSVTETQTGENLFDKTTVTDNTWIVVNDTTTESTVGFRTSDYIPVKANTRYYVSAKGSNRTAYYDRNKNGIAYFAFSGGASFNSLYDGYIRLTIKNDVNLDTFIVNEGNTAITYEPYKGTTYTASLGRTIHGGTADIVNGVGQEKYKIFTASDVTSLYWNGKKAQQVDTNHRTTFRIALPSGYITVNNSLCNELSYTVNIASGSGEYEGYQLIATAGIYFCIDLADIGMENATSDTPDKEFINAIHNYGDNLKFVVELATPTDFTFTGQEVPTRLGYNAFWSDEGDTEVTYRADINLALGGQ